VLWDIVALRTSCFDTPFGPVSILRCCATADCICYHQLCQELFCDVQIVKDRVPSISAIGQALPAAVETLQTDLKQSTRELCTLARAHSACSDVAKLCSQVQSQLPCHECCDLLCQFLLAMDPRCLAIAQA
jgi:hypothetical protein